MRSVTIDFVTLFDSKYMAQGLTMVRSLLRTTQDARLWVVAADEYIASALSLIGHEHLRVVSLEQVETSELRAVRATRSPVEYYWTLTPFLPSYIFAQKPTSELAVYVDADMYFMKSAHHILEEFEKRSNAVAMVTPHDYLPKYDQSASSGKFCVQFMPFRRVGSERILRDWQNQCLEWCYNRVEPGRFGDQKYLDAWPRKYGAAVHVQTSVNLLGAPWNAGKRNPSSLAAYHFHGLRRVSRQFVVLHPGYQVPREFRQRVYRPYLTEFSSHPQVQQATFESGRTRLRPFASLVLRLAGDFWRAPSLQAPIARTATGIPRLETAGASDNGC